MDIKKLRELCEKATPGPWEVGNHRGYRSIEPNIVSGADGYGGWYAEPEINDAQFIAAARTALPELLDEVERLRKEVRLLNEKINVIKWSIVEAVGGVSYDGQTTNTLHCLQRLRILVEKEKALSLACSQLADVMEVCPAEVMEVCPAELEWCESRECPGNRGKCWEDYFLEKVRGE